MRTDVLNAPAGTSIMIGAPARPAISPDATAALAAALARMTGVAEAHLPQIFAPGVSEAPAQALVLVLQRGVAADHVMQALGPQLAAIIPSGVHLDVWPLESRHALVPAVRAAACRIYEAPRGTRPWWKFWA